MPEAAPSAGGQGEGPAPTATPEAGQDQVQGGQPGPGEGRDLDTAERSTDSGDLPGVVSQKASKEDQELADELWPELKGRQDQDGAGEDGEEGKKKGRDRPRGPDGRFLKADGTPEGDQRPESPPDPGVDPESGQKADEFEFAGRKWENQEKADQSIRSALGMIKPLTEQRNEYQAAYSSWKDYAEREIAARDARIAELEAGSGQPGSGDAGSSKSVQEDDVNKIIDWDAYRYINTKGTPEQAAQFMLAQVLEHINTKVLPARLDEVRQEMRASIQPVAEQHRQQQTVEAMTNVTTQMAAYKLADGRQAFPELSDVGKVEQIGKLWAQEASSEADAERRLQMLTTPHGLMQAIAHYRFVMGMMEQPASSAGNKPQDSFTDEPPADGAAASLPAGGRDGFTPPGASGGRLTPEAAFAAELDHGPMMDDDLGFVRNRSASRR